jgi:DNA-binding response OmpR family regulator
MARPRPLQRTGCTRPRSNVVDVYVGYLRRKLGNDRIVTVRGMGFRLEAGAPKGR